MNHVYVIIKKNLILDISVMRYSIMPISEKVKKMTSNPQKNIGIIDFFKKDFSSGVPDFLTDNTVQYLSYKFEKTHFGHFCDEIS